jgi:hypothetical protein
MRMRNRLLLLPAVAAGLAVAVTAVTSAAARPAPASAGPGVLTAAARAWARTVVLITGDRLMAAGAQVGRQGVAVLPAGSGRGGSLLGLGVGGRSYEIPAAAVPYLGQGLDMSLFNVGDLLRAEHGGRVPVRVAYRGRRPSLPGVRFTRVGGGVAAGYVTASSARVFGAALLRQFAADHVRGSYGQDGMFAGGVSVSLAGTVPARGGQATSLVQAAQPQFRMHTLTVTGTNLAGRPDTGGYVMVVNTDDASRFAEGDLFYRGALKMSVPTGHYWAVGMFSDFHRMVILPQFTVARDATVKVDERTATSKIMVATPRPSQAVDTNVNVLRSGAAGPNSYAFISGQGQAPLYVSPTTQRPTVGKLQVLTSWVRLSPKDANGIPYAYYLEHLDDSGLIRRSQQYVVRPGSLATVRARYYSDIPGNGVVTWLGVPSALANDALGFDEAGFPVRLPGRQTTYLTAGTPPIVWEGGEQSENSADGQLGPFREFRPGGHVTEDWGAFPLHPAPNVNLIGAIAGSNNLAPSLVSASRSGDTLTLDISPFSDNAHNRGTRFTGYNDESGVTVAGRYEIDENGKKIASGKAVSGVMFGDFYTTAALAPKLSTIRFTLDASVTGAHYPLSPASHTVWTWRSSHEAGATVPRGWACRWVSTPPHLRGRDCAAEPMMTLGYRVAGLALDGSAPAGRQLITLTAGHLQLAAAARITRAAAQVSFDDGKTWHAAAVTGSGGTYRAVFTATAGSYVTLRVTAADAAGGRISETITRAYKTAP